MANITRIIVADSLKARCFEIPNFLSPMEEKLALMNLSARFKEQDLTSDSHGKGCPKSTAKEHAEDMFISQLAELIIHEFRTGQFHSLVFIAPPRFLGRLRKKLPKNILALVKESHNKDLTHQKPEEIEKYINRNDLYGILAA